MSKPEPSVEEISERLLRKLLKRHSTWLGDEFLADGVSVIVSALQARDVRAVRIIQEHRDSDICKDNCWKTNVTYTFESVPKMQKQQN